MRVGSVDGLSAESATNVLDGLKKRVMQVSRDASAF
jgi:hypothetical protein